MVVYTEPVDTGREIANYQNNVRLHMERLGMDETELARKAKASRPHIANLIRGDTPGSIHLLIRVSKALGVPTSELFDEPIYN